MDDLYFRIAIASKTIARLNFAYRLTIGTHMLQDNNWGCKIIIVSPDTRFLSSGACVPSSRTF